MKAILDTSTLIATDVPNLEGELAISAAAISGRQSRSGVMDLLIAATAHAHAARLYTRNAADLTGIEHLVEIVSI